MPVATQTTAGTRNAPRQPTHCGEDGGDAGGQRHAEIAADAVERERAAAIGRGRDHDGGADRMIDRGEHAEREQRDRERDEVGRHRRRREAEPAADIEHHHHVAAAPVVGEPAGRQREDAEGEERRGAEREQLAVGAAVDRFEPDHHGREDQHHVMVDRVREIVEADRQPPAGLVVRRRRGSSEFAIAGPGFAAFARPAIARLRPARLCPICNSE